MAQNWEIFLAKQHFFCPLSSFSFCLGIRNLYFIFLCVWEWPVAVTKNCLVIQMFWIDYFHEIARMYYHTVILLK